MYISTHTCKVPCIISLRRYHVLVQFFDYNFDFVRITFLVNAIMGVLVGITVCIGRQLSRMFSPSLSDNRSRKTATYQLRTKKKITNGRDLHKLCVCEKFHSSMYSVTCCLDTNIGV